MTELNLFPTLLATPPPLLLLSDVPVVAVEATELREPRRSRSISASSISPSKSLGMNEESHNGQIKGMISSSILILFYTIQQVIPNICTKFQNPRCSSSWEVFDTNFPMYCIGVRDWKRKNGKRRQKLITASWFSFPQHIWPVSRCIQNLKTLALIGAKISMIEIFIGEREKWTNRGNDT